MNRVRIGDFLRQSTGLTTRVSLEVDGAPIWFESDCLPPDAAPEAWATALLIPCLLNQRTLEISQAVCGTWYDNVQLLVELLSQNWGVPQISVLANTCVVDSAPQVSSAQFFSGGVDSFYTLLNSKVSPDYLFFVEGFDVLLHESARLEKARQCLNKVASASGSRSCTIRSNIRQHPMLLDLSWDDTHSGVLAAVGHVLAPHIGSVTIAPSWHKSYYNPVIYGSNWRTDPLWSSRRLTVVHGDASLLRTERVFAIANERIVQENLRVCNSELALSINCSRCDKCIRTMLDLYQAGKLAAFSVFDSSVPLWELIDRLPYVPFISPYQEALDRGVEPGLGAAIRRLLRRTQSAVAAATDIQSDNQSLRYWNSALEGELRRLQEEVASMQQGKAWRIVNALRQARSFVGLLRRETFENSPGHNTLSSRSGRE